MAAMMDDTSSLDTSVADLDSTAALRLISPFFGAEWASTNAGEVKVTRVTGGMINTLHLARRTSHAVHEPSAVLVRHFGLNGEHEEPTGDSVTLSTVQQAVVHWEMARRDWGPQVYGIFSGGRVEEYIDAHPLSAAESVQPAIRTGVARSYARLHSLDLPLRCDGYELVNAAFKDGVVQKRQEVLNVLQSIDDPRAQLYRATFESTNWCGELDWLAGIFARHGCKRTVTHGDANLLNLLVRNYAHECPVMLIDYETVSYSYRGFDIGGHFNERMYNYHLPDTQLSGYDAPSSDEQRAFCESYLAELENLGKPSTNEVSVDHLLVEATIGRMYQLLFTNMMCMVFDEAEDDALFLSGLQHMMETYQRLKIEFVQEHGC